MGQLYSFPVEYESEYPGYIEFEAFKEDFSSYLASIYSSAILSELDTSQTGDAVLLETISTARRSFYGINEDQQPQKGATVPTEPGDKVRLYLPTNIQFTDGIEYGTVDLGPKGAAVAKALGEGGGLTGVLAAGFEGVLGIGSIQDLIRQGLGAQAGQIALTRLLAGRSEELRGAIESQTGVTINPNRRSLLRGVSIRRFRFTFKLIPASSKESQAIKDIIRFFRTEMYPEDIPVADVVVGMEFPSKFNIRMVYNGSSVATGILPCYLENVDTNYNPSSMGMHRNPDGTYSFPEIDFSMSFIEDRALRRQDIVDGNY